MTVLPRRSDLSSLSWRPNEKFLVSDLGMNHGYNGVASFCVQRPAWKPWGPFDSFCSFFVYSRREYIVVHRIIGVQIVTTYIH